MLIVTAILLPLIIFYTSYTYKVFSGKLKGPEQY
jgi:cytochrome bd-type quinol oxidase subunit 2